MDTGGSGHHTCKHVQHYTLLTSWFYLGNKKLKKGKGDATVELEVGNWNEENGR